MKLALITDTHSGVRNDSGIFHDNLKLSLDKVFFPYLEEHGITTIIHLGDVLDRQKYLNYVTAKRVREDLFEPVVARNLDMHMLLGNHDTFYKDTNLVNCLKELVDGKYPFKIYDKVTETVFDDLPILMVPWIPTGEPEKRFAFDMIAKSRSEVCFGHLELTGYEYLRGIIATDKLDPSTFSKFDVVYSGHYHHPSRKDNVTYLGAFNEQTWADWNDPRGFHIFDTATRSLQFIKNPHSIFHMLSYDDVKYPNIQQQILNKDYSSYHNTYVKIVVVNKTNPYAFDMMLDKLDKAGVLDISVIEDISSFTDESVDGQINETEDTITILNNYLDNLTLPVKTDKMKNFMQEVYNEAIALENIT